MVKVVEERYKSTMMEKGDADELLKRTGDVGSALDMYARSGDWDKCLQLAEKQGPKMLPHYLVQYAKILCNQGSIMEACQKLITFGPPPEPSNFQLYKLICTDLLASSDAKAAGMLKDMLLRLFTSGMMPPSMRALAE